MKVSEQNPVQVKILSMKNVTEKDLASGKVGSAYSDDEVVLPKMKEKKSFKQVLSGAK